MATNKKRAGGKAPKSVTSRPKRTTGAKAKAKTKAKTRAKTGAHENGEPKRSAAEILSASVATPEGNVEAVVSQSADASTQSASAAAAVAPPAAEEPAGASDLAA